MLPDPRRGVAEIAELLGVTRQRVSQLQRTDGFPEPIARLSAGAIYRLEDVREWARANGRL